MNTSLYEKKHLIQVHEIDFKGKLSICGLFNLCMEIAWENAEQLAFGFHDLQRKELFWVLSKIHLKIDHYPHRLSNINLQTNPVGKSGLYAYRNFQIINEDRSLCAEAKSAWLVLDTANRKILKLDEDLFFNQFNTLEDYPVLKLKEKPEMIPTEYAPVYPSDIDINGHMNAGKYLERVYNSFDFNFLKNHELQEMTINFNKEGMMGDSVGVLKTSLEDNTYMCSVIRKNDMAELCRMKLKWQ